MHAPSLPSMSVRINPMFVSGYCVHPNVLGPWSVIGLQGWTPRVAFPMPLLADLVTQGGGHCKAAGLYQRHAPLATRPTDDAPQAAPVHVGASSTSSRANSRCPDRNDMVKAVSSCCTALALSAPAPQISWATFKCPHRDDMTKAVSSLYCLVLDGVSSREQSGHLQVPGLTP